MALAMMGVVLAMAAGASGEVGGSAQERQLAQQKATDTRVYAKVVDGRLVLRSLGPANIRVEIGVDLDDDRRINGKDPYYTWMPDGTFCAARQDARGSLACTPALRAVGSREAIGTQLLLRIEVPLTELAPHTRQVPLLLVMDKPEGGVAKAWLGYDLVTGDVRALPADSPSAAVAAAPKPSAPAAVASAGCPSTLATLSQSLAGRRVVERKDEVKFTRVEGFSLMPQDGEDRYDPKQWSLLGAVPLRVQANIRGGKPVGLFASLPGHDIKPYEAAFRAQFGGRGTIRCNAMECRWLLVPYPGKAPKGVLGDASITLYNMTKDETWLFCKYGE
jgi:hypothetical protein